MSGYDSGGMLGGTLGRLILWGGVAAIGYVAVADRLPWPPRSAPAAEQETSGHMVSPEGNTGSPIAVLRPANDSLSYRADPRGHFWVDAVVNGASVRFMVDTGATNVALSLKDAEAAGLGHSSLAFTMRTSTANGVARAAPVQLREIRIGQFAVDNVPAIVGENLDISLLGMTFLRKLQSYEIRDGVLTMNWD